MSLAFAALGTVNRSTLYSRQRRARLREDRERQEQQRLKTARDLGESFARLGIISWAQAREPAALVCAPVPALPSEQPQPERVRECQWIEAGRFCGEAVVRLGVSYCAAHARRVFDPNSPSYRAALAEAAD